MNRLKRSLHKQIVDELGLKIIGGELGVGDTLPNADDLSDELGVSRTVTREAIKVLEEKGLLSSRPKTGIRVLPTTAWKLLDEDVIQWHYECATNAAFLRHLMQVRRVIEPSAAQLAAQHATEEELATIQAEYARLAAATDNLQEYKAADRAFHAAIFAATHNPLLVYIGKTINADLDAGRDVTATVPRSLVESLPIHRQLAQAIQQRDGSAAHHLAIELVEQISRYIEEAIAQRRL